MLRALLISVGSRGMREALERVRAERAIQRLHRRGVRRAHRYADASDLKLNFGCGPNPKQGWVNVDLCYESDLRLDVREPLPFRDGVASIVYSEHFLEHLAYPDEVQRFLAESLRVLRPGGVFSVGVPDTEWPMRCVLEGGGEWFETVKRLRWHPEWCDLPMHSLNYHFRQDGEHRYAWDRASLIHVLEQSGFVSVERRDFDPTLDHESRRIGTVHVVGRKR